MQVEAIGGYVCPSRASLGYPMIPSDNESGPIVCCEQCVPTTATRACFCSRKGRIFSTTCICHSPRHALFSVSQQVREDSIAIYYSRNRFLVTPFGCPTMNSVKTSRYHNFPPLSHDKMRHVELSLYISALTRNAVQNIRWLEWLLPAARQKYLLPGTRTWIDYLDTLDMMRHAMRIEALTFVLNMAAGGYSQWREDWDGNPYREVVPVTDWQWYEQIALALGRLGPLKDCFIYLGRNGPESRVNERIRRERSLERAIMGEHYDSTSRGKPEERITAISKASDLYIYYPNPNR
jgi:hypothetical protein